MPAPQSSDAIVHSDSRKVRRNETFVSPDVPERREFEAAAQRAGAARIIREGEPGPNGTSNARWAHARSVAAATGADRVTIPIIGITGTDGKTTTNWLAWQLIGKGAARVGTLGFHDGQEASPSRHTMPPADEMMPFIAGLPATCPGLVVELSSHGLDQHRLAGVSLQALAITNIGRDHLDYHGSFTHYVEAKLRAVELVNLAASSLLMLMMTWRHALPKQLSSVAAGCSLLDS